MDSPLKTFTLIERIVIAEVENNATTLTDLLEEVSSSQETSLSPWGIYLQSQLAMVRSDLEEVQDRVDKALQVFQEVDDAQGVTLATLTQARLLWTRRDRENAHRKATEALELAEATGCSYLEARVLRTLGFTEASQLRHENARQYFLRSIDRFMECQMETAVAVVRLNLSGVLYTIGHQITREQDLLQKAIALSEQSRAVFLEHDLHRLAANSYELSAGMFAHLGEYGTALEHMHRALATLTVGPPTSARSTPNGLLSDLYAGIAYIHQRARNLDVAREYLLKSIDIATDEASIIDRQFSLGVVCVWSGQFEESLELYLTCLTWMEDHNSESLTFCLLNIAHCLQELRRHDTAEHYLNRAEEVMAAADEVGSDNLLMERAWYSIVKSRQLLHHNELDQAIAMIDQQLDRVDPLTHKWEFIEIHSVLRDIALAKNDLQAYVKHNDIVTKNNEELRGAKTQQQLVLLEMERDVEKERQERERERAVLYSALPKAVADRVIRGEKVNDDHFNDAAVLFLDIAGFTKLSSTIPPGHVIHLLDAIFNTCDDIVDRHNVTKIKTIGDSYMAVAFPEIGDQRTESGDQRTESGDQRTGSGDQRTESGDQKAGSGTARRAAAAALDLIAALSVSPADFLADLPNGFPEGLPDRLQVRIGLHIGPVVAGVIGSKRLQYDVWGDTVNVASRMESTGEPGRVQVSSEFHEQLSSQAGSPVSDLRSLKFTKRGEVNVKGKGTMTTYWLDRG